MATILVADDEEDVRDLVRYALVRSGHIVLESQTGVETLELLNAAPRIDLLILDIMMPQMDGIAVQQEMSHIEKLKHIPVIVISSAQITRESFSQFKQMKRFMPKPFDPIELSEVINEVLMGGCQT